ncbi:hypothetical protein TSAR_011893 [Trichomalopsis sarcophagae]|uniref:Uncharacterized protein n=1 Tax=Trichomalopsis sarcophagae TaxID=543379 RepID=A0A232EZE9_9HYME|nr:hypothetical protein TSAR_011893 [Trichomalopsis sarcophagae]
MYVFDASAKYPYGIIDGQTRHLGSFDQCYRIDAQVRGADGFENVKGRYCLVDYKYQQRDATADFKGKLNFEFDPNESVWEAIREKGDFRRIRRYMLQMALCVPAACSAEDVQRALQGPFESYAAKNNLLVKVSVDPNNCQAYHEEPEFSTGAFVYCCVLFSIFALVVVASLYDGTLSTEEEKLGTSRGRQLLLCFSAKRNLHTIFEVSYKHRGLDTIHLLRFVSTCFVVAAHRMMQYYLNTVVNERNLEITIIKMIVMRLPYFQTYDVPSFVMVHNGPIIVDGFFAIGGLLACYGLLDQFDKTKRVNFLGLTLIRFLRFTPAYALLIFFNVYLFQHMGSGPQWKSKIGVEADNCAATWWAHLFYLNNYMTMDRICIFQSWYLAVDFHCYLIGIALIYAFWKYPRRVGYSILGAATFVSILIPFYLTYVYRIQPLFIGFPYLNDLQIDPYFVNYYVKSHLRMTAYLVGVISGAILYDYQKASWRISKRLSQGLFVLLVVLLGIYSQSLGYQYYNPNSNPSSLEMALYASLHRGTFAASYCAIILLITMGDGLDLHYNFLTPGWAQPLGRLTYSVFLSHNILQSYDVGSARSARTFSICNTFWDSIPDVVCSFSLALLIAIGIEGPFRKLEKYFIVKRSKNIPIPATNSNKETDKLD